MNKDEALRCLEIASSARSSGDLGKAERFIEKSIKLFPTPEANNMLAAVKSAQQKQHDNRQRSPSKDNTNSSSSSNSTSSNNNTSSSAPPPKPKPAPTAAPASSKPSSTPAGPVLGVDYTVEQRDSARQIKKLKNHYEVLSLTKSCTESEVKIAYRKLALKFHPDKNRAPEAEDAFKLVSTAFQTLSDTDKRAHYDRYGEDANTNAASSAANSAFGRQSYYREEDLSAEDIFNMFFGGGGVQTSSSNGGQQTYRRTFRAQATRRTANTTQQQQTEQPRGPVSFIMQFAHFLPLILLFLFSFLSMPGSDTDNQPFSLSRSNSNPIQRQTESHHIDYWVNQAFQYRYARDRRALYNVESTVESQWKKVKSESCDKERQQQKSLRDKARKLKGSEAAELFQQAESMNLDSCEQLRAVFAQ